MAPKKKAGGGKKTRGKPSWMTDEMYALSTNLQKLQEFWCGDVKESKGKGKDGKPLPDFPNISKEQVCMRDGRTEGTGGVHVCACVHLHA